MAVDQAPKFPNDPILVQLLRAAGHVSGTETIVCDVGGFEKTYQQLFADILKTRVILRERLPPSAYDARNLLREGQQYIGILTRTGYEFLVAFFAIRAIGGVCMPLSSGILPEEAQFFLSKAKSTCILAGKDRAAKAAKIHAVVAAKGHTPHFAACTISSDATPRGDIKVAIDHDIEMSPGGPGLVIFTSGTTGIPKGVVLPRRCLVPSDNFEPGCAVVTHRPAHWIGGASAMLHVVLTGKRLHHLGEMAKPESVLAAFRDHQITHCSFTPTLLRKMRECMTGQARHLSEEKRVEYSRYFSSLSILRSVSGTVDQSTVRFWTDLTGLPFQNAYGATEMGCSAIESMSTKEGVIGTPISGVKVKLSEGNHGEIHIKSPGMMIRYLDDEKLTQAALDEEGYYKSGDLAELRDGEYVFAGRASTDFVLFRGYRISTLAVENSLMELPYIAEACAVGVPHKEALQLCGAVVRLRRTSVVPPKAISLTRIRSDLRGKLPQYMLPIVVRILKDDENFSRTASGKCIKPKVLREYFGTTEWFSVDDLPPGVEYCGSTVPMIVEAETRPWDWSGIQCAG
ncbi:hypothetical protein B0J13DRAFT_637862 [Dactylonectria estremocensis]|uniref:AMP-dependent synthetase/ligase domain-containing protein n=1 Tax=Dactylonectria estremocensis TaxID=1079267 RepID=A0A9P9EMU0_9HYPO|nr:hypothetical protein B0J13DRAFT_637862 [Dactylonectria estremocensis]